MTNHNLDEKFYHSTVKFRSTLGIATHTLQVTNIQSLAKNRPANRFSAFNERRLCNKAFSHFNWQFARHLRDEVLVMLKEVAECFWLEVIARKTQFPSLMAAR